MLCQITPLHMPLNVPNAEFMRERDRDNREKDLFSRFSKFVFSRESSRNGFLGRLDVLVVSYVGHQVMAIRGCL